MQWEALRSYFISEFEEDDSLDEEKVTREARLIRQFNDLFTKLCVLFVQAIMPVFDQFNTFLQSEEPLVHLLHESTIKLYKGLLSRFIKTEIFSTSNDVLLIDIENSESLKELNTIHIGFITKQYAVAEDIIGTPRYIKFLREVQSFFITSSKYLPKSMSTLRDPLLKCFSIFLRPSERSKIEEEHVSLLIKRFPQIVQTENFHKLHAELLEYQNETATELPSEIDSNKARKRTDLFWLEVKDSITGIQRFPNLSTLARFLLLIPHSNAFCEGVFSTVRKILKDSRYNLGKDVKKGRAHSSVYETETGIRNNLVGLLISKINVFKQQNIKCYQWEQSETSMKTAKSITYQNLSASVKNSQS